MPTSQKRTSARPPAETAVATAEATTPDAKPAPEADASAAVKADPPTPKADPPAPKADPPPPKAEARPAEQPVAPAESPPPAPKPK